MRSKIDSPAVTEPQRDDRTLATEKWIVQSRGVPFLRRPPGRFVRESGYLIRIINSARSLSPRFGVREERPAKRQFPHGAEESSVASRSGPDSG